MRSTPLRHTPSLERCTPTRCARPRHRRLELSTSTTRLRVLTSLSSTHGLLHCFSSTRMAFLLHHLPWRVSGRCASLASWPACHVHHHVHVHVHSRLFSLLTVSDDAILHHVVRRYTIVTSSHRSLSYLLRT